MRKVSFLVFALATIWSVSALAAPPLLPVQGRLLDSGGQAINDAQIVVFRVYDVPVGGTHVFEETQLIQFSNGYFVAYMGENPPLPLTMFEGAPELWLGVKVGDDAEMTPRLRMGAAPSAPFANSCGSAETLGTFGPNDFAINDHDHNGDYAPAGPAADVNCSGCVENSDLASDAVDTSKLANESVTSAKIGDGQVVRADLGLTTFAVGVDTINPTAKSQRCSDEPDQLGEPVDALFCALAATWDQLGGTPAYNRVRCYIERPDGLWRICTEAIGTDTVVGCQMTCLR